jgi:hypothetical protein
VADYYEIDFMAVEAAKSGDAIPIRYELNGVTTIHVVDGGFADTGDSVVKHINEYYGKPTCLQRVIVTHPDGDHACGLQKVLEQFEVKELWMLRPWLYAAEILDRFERFTSAENLAKRLKECYPYIASLEEIAERRRIPIFEPFQGAKLGPFTVLAPTRARYLDLIVASEKTPESVEEGNNGRLGNLLIEVAKKVVSFIRAAWGDEAFSASDTSAENEMSVVQFANLCGERILLTADAGRGALTEAADYAPSIGLDLPGISRFQVPHHGSRRNVSTEVLDRWVGERLPKQPEKGEELFTAVISSAEADKDHPRKSVERAFMHRGASVLATEGKTIRVGKNAPARHGWVPAVPRLYPEEQEE